jgi:hypothetical protein
MTEKGLAILGSVQNASNRNLLSLIHFEVLHRTLQRSRRR